MPEASPSTSPETTGPRRIQAVVALRLLETMRDMDLPQEILQDEDPTQTIPRRFGLNDVVERQIRTYRDDVRRRVKLTDGEIRDLLRFVIRRPDSTEVLHRVGRLLAGGERAGRWVRILPRGLQFRVARRATRKRLKRLFGRSIGGFGAGPYVIEGRALMFIESDPGGDACAMLSGFCEEVLEQVLGGKAAVRHTHCQAREQDLCRWEGDVVEERATVAIEPVEEPG